MVPQFPLVGVRRASMPAGLLLETSDRQPVGIAAEQLGSHGRPLIEPGSLFVDGNYTLRVNSWNVLTGCILTIRIRFLSSDGRIGDYDVPHTPNTNRTKATTDIPLAIGFPLNVMIFASTGAPLIGQTFAQAQLVRGFSGATLPVATLLQGYVTSAQAVAWPGSPIQSSLDGDGYPRTVTGSTPGAGAEISETVPAGARWRIAALYTFFSTSAVVSNRVTALRLVSGGITLGYSCSNVAQTATQIVNYTWGEGVQMNSMAVGQQQRQLPTPIALELFAGMQLNTVTSGLDAADQYAAMQMTVHERLEAA